MPVRTEREFKLGEPLKKEQRYLKLPPYSRDGLIPGWSEVIVEFNLNKYHPRDFRLFRGYYRAQRRIAEGRSKKAGKIFKGLDRNPDFGRLREREELLLTDIATFIRRRGRKE